MPGQLLRVSHPAFLRPQILEPERICAALRWSIQIYRTSLVEKNAIAGIGLLEQIPFLVDYEILFNKGGSGDIQIGGNSVNFTFGNPYLSRSPGAALTAMNTLKTYAFIEKIALSVFHGELHI